MILKTDWKFYLSVWLVGLVAKLTPWTAACLAPLFMEFSRQDYSGGLPFPSPGYLPDPGNEPMSPEAPALQVNSLLSEPSEKPRDKRMNSK